jgi:hypothetical protein
LTVMTGQTCKAMTCVPWQPLASLTRTVMLVAGLAAAVGVPLMMPVPAPNVRPAGKVPAVMVQVP